jgi:hypothetical protein
MDKLLVAAGAELLETLNQTDREALLRLLTRLVQD